MSESDVRSHELQSEGRLVAQATAWPMYTHLDSPEDSDTDVPILIVDSLVPSIPEQGSTWFERQQ